MDSHFGSMSARIQGLRVWGFRLAHSQWAGTCSGGRQVHFRQGFVSCSSSFTGALDLGRQARVLASYCVFHLAPTAIRISATVRRAHTDSVLLTSTSSWRPEIRTTNRQAYVACRIQRTSCRPSLRSMLQCYRSTSTASWTPQPLSNCFVIIPVASSRCICSRVLSSSPLTSSRFSPQTINSIQRVSAALPCFAGASLQHISLAALDPGPFDEL